MIDDFWYFVIGTAVGILVNAFYNSLYSKDTAEADQLEEGDDAS